MNTHIQLTKLQQLEKVLHMITLCQRYLNGDKKTLQTEACNRLPVLKSDAEKRVKFRTQVLNRLQAYYAKKCFQLYLASLQSIELQPPPLLKLNTEAGWNPDGVRINNELLIYGPSHDHNPARA